MEHIHLNLGDLILFDYDRSSYSDHIGIVGSVANGIVYTIEGNKNNAVRYCSYELGDPQIRAYCIPAYDESTGTGNRYENGSTKEEVYCDTECTTCIGYLNPYECCDCLGIFNDRAIVRYIVDGTANIKIGFVKWLGGVK